MKNLSVKILALFAIAVISFSCRQQDDILSNEDLTNLKVIQNTRDSNTTNSAVAGTENSNMTVDGEIVPPPRK